jgi:hypothetical protein
MLASLGGRGSHGWRTIVGSMTAAMFLAEPVQAGDTLTNVAHVVAPSGSIVSGQPILTLKLFSGGIYAIFAKLNLDQDDTIHMVTVTCTLTAGPDLDLNVVRLQPSGKSVDNATIPFQIVQSFRRNTQNDIVLSCTFPNLKSSLLSFRFAKITAIQLDGVLCEHASPADCLKVD